MRLLLESVSKTNLAPTNSSHSSIRFHCKIVSNGEKSKTIDALSPVHVDGKTTFWFLIVADIFFFTTLLVLGFIIFLFSLAQFTLSGKILFHCKFFFTSSDSTKKHFKLIFVFPLKFKTFKGIREIVVHLQPWVRNLKSEIC